MPGTIHNRSHPFEADGVLEGYHAQIDYERVEGRLTNLFVCTVPVAEREGPRPGTHEEHLLQREHHRPYHAFWPGGDVDRTGIMDLISLIGGAEGVELTVDEGAPLAGHTLKDANAEGRLVPSVLAIGIGRGEETVTIGVTRAGRPTIW